MTKRYGLRDFFKSMHSTLVTANLSIPWVKTLTHIMSCWQYQSIVVLKGAIRDTGCALGGSYTPRGIPGGAVCLDVRTFPLFVWQARVVDQHQEKKWDDASSACMPHVARVTAVGLKHTWMTVHQRAWWRYRESACLPPWGSTTTCRCLRVGTPGCLPWWPRADLAAQSTWLPPVARANTAVIDGCVVAVHPGTIRVCTRTYQQTSTSLHHCRHIGEGFC